MAALYQFVPELLASLRVRILSRRPLIAVTLIALLFAAHVSTASAQFKLQQTFTDTIRLQANENMRFDKELFKVHTGKKLTLIFKNTAAPSATAMAHNVVILKPGIDIADFADVARNAQKEEYIPSSVASLIIAHTRLVNGGDSDQVEFTISQPAVYDFICSFPGHWGTMQGKIVAE